MADPEQRAKFTDQIEEQVETLRRKFQEIQRAANARSQAEREDFTITSP